MVRIIEFEDFIQWVARLRMPHLSEDENNSALAKIIMASEYSTIQLIQKESKILTPRVHLLELDANCPVKAPFMLMDCLPGNVGMDLDMKIPPEHKSAVFEQMAKIHVG
jgi:hypothetical protein